MRYSPDGRALGKKTTKRPPQPETYFEGWGVNDDVGRRKLELRAKRQPKIAAVQRYAPGADMDDFDYDLIENSI